MLRLAQFTAVVLSVTAATAAAQGLRVSTVVYDASRLDRSGKEPVLSRSITLFHNGRAYDYVEAAGEVVVFDKASKRFTVINAGHGVFTRVAFAELQALCAYATCASSSCRARRLTPWIVTSASSRSPVA